MLQGMKHYKTSILWKLLERFSSQGIQLVSQIILARLLLPSDYGLIAYVLILINFANVFIQQGITTAIVQKKKISNQDLSSAFLTMIFITTLIYTVLYLSAPAISAFYKQEELILIIRVLTISLFFASYSSVQISYLSRNFDFKKIFLVSIVSSIASFLIALILAINGFSVWALVWQQLAYKLFEMILYFIVTSWVPKLVVSLKSLKDLYGFGWKMMSASFINTLYNELSSMIIGRLYTPEMLGYYTKGKQIPSYASSAIDSSIQAVMLPAYSSLQEKPLEIRQLVRKTMGINVFFIFPFLLGLAALSREIVLLLLTEKWLDSVIYMQIACFAYLLHPINTASLQAIASIGRSDLRLKLEVIKKTIGLFVIILLIPLGPVWIATSAIFMSVMSTILNLYPMNKLFGYKLKHLIKDTSKAFFASIVMFSILSLSNIDTTILFIDILIKFALGFSIYVGVSYLLKSTDLIYIVGQIRLIIKKLLFRN